MAASGPITHVGCLANQVWTGPVLAQLPDVVLVVAGNGQERWRMGHRRQKGHLGQRQPPSAPLGSSSGDVEGGGTKGQEAHHVARQPDGRIGEVDDLVAVDHAGPNDTVGPKAYESHPPDRRGRERHPPDMVVVPPVSPVARALWPVEAAGRLVAGSGGRAHRPKPKRANKRRKTPSPPNWIPPPTFGALPGPTSTTSTRSAQPGPTPATCWWSGRFPGPTT